MNLLPAHTLFSPSGLPPVDQLRSFVECVTGGEHAYSVLAGEVDVLDCSLVANKCHARSNSGSVRASVARSTHKLNAAARLVQERYAWRGYMTASDAPAAEDDRCALTLVAETADEIVGTITLGLDGPRGLFADESYAAPLSVVRSQGRRVSELRRLALAGHADTRTVLSTLFSLAYGVGKALQDVTDVFIEVNPRHVAFYRRVLGFVVVGGERLCERVQAPAVLLRTSVDELEARLQVYCSAAASELASSAHAQIALA